jgi:TPR repeat protein
MNLAARPWIAAAILSLLAGCSDSLEERLIKEFEGYRTKAERGDVQAQDKLAEKYYTGKGVERSQVQAVFWYRKAAEQGYAPAQSNLALCYMIGTGVAKDEVQAISLYRKAAEQGYAPAQSFLGVCYVCGWGVAKDEIEAYALHSLARTEDESRKWLAILEKRMSRDEIASGKQRTIELQKEIEARVAAKQAGK